MMSALSQLYLLNICRSCVEHQKQGRVAQNGTANVWLTELLWTDGNVPKNQRSRLNSFAPTAPLPQRGRVAQNGTATILLTELLWTDGNVPKNQRSRLNSFAPTAPLPWQRRKRHCFLQATLWLPQHSDTSS